VLGAAHLYAQGLRIRLSFRDTLDSRLLRAEEVEPFTTCIAGGQSGTVEAAGAYAVVCSWRAQVQGTIEVKFDSSDTYYPRTAQFTTPGDQELGVVPRYRVLGSIFLRGRLFRVDEESQGYPIVRCTFERSTSTSLDTVRAFSGRYSCPDRGRSRRNLQRVLVAAAGPGVRLTEGHADVPCSAGIDILQCRFVDTLNIPLRAAQAPPVLEAVVVAKGSGQQKLATLGVGVVLGADSAAYSLSFALVGSNVAFFRGFGNRDWIGLRPSAAANIGNGTRASPNNVFFDFAAAWSLLTTYTDVLFVEVAPSASADKSFSTGLLYLATGTRYLVYRKDLASTTGFSVTPGIRVDLGRRYNEAGPSNNFYRVVPSLRANIEIGAKFTADLNTEVFVVRGDDQVIPAGSYGNVTVAVDYRLARVFSFTCRYVAGHDQPLYKRLNAVMIGASLYR